MSDVAQEAATPAAESADAAGTDEVKKPAKANLPDVDHPIWGALKSWVRQELDLAMQGRGPEERADLNP